MRLAVRWRQPLGWGGFSAYRCPLRPSEVNRRTVESVDLRGYLNPRCERRLARRLARVAYRVEGTDVRVTKKRRSLGVVLRFLVLALGGCYASHEPGACVDDSECRVSEYCELRFACELQSDGSVTCDPFAHGCVWLDGGIVCDVDPWTGLGWCAPDDSRSLWR